jgi:hypothetical protein
MAAAKPKIRNTQISNSGSPPALAAIFSSRWARIEFTQNPARRPILQSNVGLVQPALALSRSSEVLELQATDQLSPSCESVYPFFALKPTFFKLSISKGYQKPRKTT